GAEGWKAACPKRVGYTRGQRRFGPHHDEIHPLRRRKLHDAPDIGRRHCNTTRELPDARIARSSEELESWIIAFELPREGVFPSAPAEDQCPHESDVLNALLKASRARANTSPTCVNASRAWLP